MRDAMLESWRLLLDAILRPTRPDLARCLAEKSRFLEEQRPANEARARRVADCEARIERARATVFAAGDGVVSALMTDLEREWRTLAKRDPDGGAMDLWARLVPSSWLDRKHWRGSPASLRLDAAALLASDLDGVATAEAAALTLAPRVRFEPWSGSDPGEVATPLLADELRPALSNARDVERAAELERRVLELARERLPEQLGLARDVAHVAFADRALHGASRTVDAIRTIWRQGYVLASVSSELVVLGWVPQSPQ